MNIGSLDAVTALDRTDLLAPTVAALLAADDGDFRPLRSASPRSTRSWLTRPSSASATASRSRISQLRGGQPAAATARPGIAACVMLATTRADVNGMVRRQLDVRKASFAAIEVAVAETGMEYGGITPMGVPAQWPVFVDAAVAAGPQVMVGSGVRRSKLIVPGEVLGRLPGAVVLDGLAR